MSKFKSGFFFLIFIWFWAFMTQNAGYECLLDKHFSGFDVIVHIFASEKLILWVKNSHALSIQNCKVFIPHCGWSGMYYATILCIWPSVILSLHAPEWKCGTFLLAFASLHRILVEFEWNFLISVPVWETFLIRSS